MKCEKCGFLNSEYDIICENCGSPLNIEKNIKLQQKYNHKPRAIDIEEIEVDTTEAVFDTAKQRVRYILVFILGVLFAFLIFLGISVIINIKEQDVMYEYDTFINNTSLGMIYLGNNSKVNDKLEEYSKEYKIEYLYIRTNKITAVKRNRLKEKLKLEKIDSTLVVVQDGKVIDYINEVSSNSDDMIDFLIENKVIPEELEKTSDVINKFDTAMNTQEATVLYIANNKNTLNDNHNKKLKEFCNDYDINYVFIEGYYLTDNQKLRILRKLNYSEIHNELLVIIDEGQIKEVSEHVSNDKKDYYSSLSMYGIIDIDSAKSLNSIDYDTSKKIINGVDKSVIIIGESNCVYCDRIKPIIGKISIQNNFVVYYYEIDESTRIEFEDYLKQVGYNEEKITSPLLIISENGSILDYIIGFSDKELYEEKFKELGIIR